MDNVKNVNKNLKINKLMKIFLMMFCYLVAFVGYVWLKPIFYASISTLVLWFIINHWKDFF